MREGEVRCGEEMWVCECGFRVKMIGLRVDEILNGIC